MCLLFFSYQTTPGYKLVIAANRDEFLDRATAPLNYLDSEQIILAGQDLQGGGTWLGVTRDGKFGAITNFREPSQSLADSPSRGEILLDFFKGTTCADDFLKALTQKAYNYNGFNLVLGDNSGLYYYSNRVTAPQRLSPGFYGLSNHLLDTPWPKVSRGKELLMPLMVTAEDVDPELIMDILCDTWRPKDEQLPETGVPFEWERLLSSIFIDSPGYGTRSSAVITISENGAVHFYEKTFLRSASKGVQPVLVTFSINDEGHTLISK